MPIELRRGDCVLVAFPFVTDAGSKRRPAVVVQADRWNRRRDAVIIAAITTAKAMLGEPGWSGGDFVSWQAGSGYLTVGPHSEVKGRSTQPGRMLIAFDTDDVQGEFARITGIGAEVVQPPYHPDEAPDIWLATLADPDGNYFQLSTPFTPFTP